MRLFNSLHSPRLYGDLIQVALLGILGIIKTQRLEIGLLWAVLEIVLLVMLAFARKIWRTIDKHNLSDRLPNAVRGFLRRNPDVLRLSVRGAGVTLVLALLLSYIDAWLQDYQIQVLMVFMTMGLLGVYVFVISALIPDRGGQVVRYENIAALLNTPELKQAKKHFSKATQFFIDPTDSDSENCIKEAVCALEASLEGFSGLPVAKDFDRAVKQLQVSGKIPQGLGECMIRVYGYRGAAKGVAHGNPQGSNVSDETAELVMNLVSAYVLYLRKTSDLR